MKQLFDEECVKKSAKSTQKAIKTVRVHCLSRVVSPLTHNSGTNGNETIVNQEPVFHDGKIKKIPVISGNALRNRCVREPGAMYLLKEIGLYGNATINQLNFLLNGGSLVKSNASDNMKIIGKMQELLPLSRLLGGCLPSQILHGSLICKRGILVCEENSQQLQSQIPEELQTTTQQLEAAQEFIGSYQYTRGDAKRHKDFSRAVNDPEIEGEKSLMIYSGQTIIPGALFYHGFILQNVCQLELGALLQAVELWQDAGSTIGGAARVGHGQLDMSLMIEGDTGWDVTESIAAYKKHVTDTAVEAYEFLNTVFA